MTAKKTTTTKASAKPKEVKPKFGQVGFRFPVMAEIISVSTDDDEYEYPVVVKVEMGGWDDWDNTIGNAIEFKYATTKSFKDFYAKCDPKFIKTQKQEELKEAQALVAKLTKELAEIK